MRRHHPAELLRHVHRLGLPGWHDHDHDVGRHFGNDDAGDRRRHDDEHDERALHREGYGVHEQRAVLLALLLPRVLLLTR